MTSFARTRVLLALHVFGLMMVGSALGDRTGRLLCGFAAVIAVVVVFRLVATLVVVLSVAMIVVSGPTHACRIVGVSLRRRLAWC